MNGRMRRAGLNKDGNSVLWVVESHPIIRFSQSYNKTGNIVLYIENFKFLERSREDKGSVWTE